MIKTNWTLKVFLKVFLLTLGVVGVVLAYFLVLDFYGVQSALTQSLCTQDANSGCSKVSASIYAIVDLGVIQIPVAVLGLVFYGVLLVLLALGLHPLYEDFAFNVAFLWLAVGLVVNAILLGISVGILDTICNLCLSNYILEALLLLIVGMGLARGLLGDFRPRAILKQDHKKALGIGIVGMLVFGSGGLWIGEQIKTAQHLEQAQQQQLQEQAKDALKSLYGGDTLQGLGGLQGLD